MGFQNESSEVENPEKSSNKPPIKRAYNGPYEAMLTFMVHLNIMVSMNILLYKAILPLILLTYITK